MLSKLIYASQAAHPMTDAELAALLSSARQHNASSGLSGMLLYSNQSFLQILEGELDALDELYTRITQDPRHSRLRLLSRGPIDSRKFAQWSMGFEKLDPDQLPGFLPEKEYPLVNPELIHNGLVAETLLDLYQRNGERDH